MIYGSSIALFTVLRRYSRDLKDRIVFLDPSSRWFRG
jgi:hypothetical protein